MATCDPAPGHACQYACPEKGAGTGRFASSSDTYEAVLATIRSNYYPGGTATDRDKLSVTKLTYAAIDGMLSSLNDRYTEFITPKEYKDMLQEQSGNFVGIGATLDVSRDHRILVVEPIEGSPAAKAGVLAGDIVVSVNGKIVSGQNIDAVIAKIRGEENTPVRLTVDRKGKLLSFSMKRGMVNSPLVRWHMETRPAKSATFALIISMSRPTRSSIPRFPDWKNKA